MNNYYVYIYLDPNKPGDYKYDTLDFSFEPFYIGKGKGNRYKLHIYNCRNSNDKFGYRRLFYNKLRKLINSKSDPIIIFYKENINEKDSFLIETELIEKIGRRIDNKGPLCNMSLGGEGRSGSISPRYKVSIYNNAGEYITTEDSVKICMKKYNVTHKIIYSQISGKKVRSFNGLRFRKATYNIENLDCINDTHINKRHKSIIQYDLSGNIISDFFSITEASIKTNISRTAINNNLCNKSKTCNRFVFKYKY